MLTKLAFLSLPWGLYRTCVEGPTMYQSFDATRGLSKIIDLATSRSAKIIGITSDQSNSGVSVVARTTAAAIGNFGKKALLVDASRVHVLSADDAPGPQLEPRDALDFKSRARNEAHVDLAGVSLGKASARSTLRASFDAALGEYDAIVVDLPPVLMTDRHPSPALLAMGPACDLIFLVAFSGIATRNRIRECVETCKIAEVKLGGLVLNDFRLTGSDLLVDR